MTNSADTLWEHIQVLPPSPELAAALLANQCQNDPEFAQALKNNPQQALQTLASDIKLEGVQVHTHENSDHTWHLPLPNYSGESVLTEEQLAKVGAGEVVGTAVGTGLWVSGVILAAATVTVAISAAIGGIGFGIHKAVKD